LKFRKEFLAEPEDLLQTRFPGKPFRLLGEAKLSALPNPAQRNVGAQFLESQIARLTSFEDRLDDVGCEECTSEDLSDVPRRQAGVEGQRSLIRRLAF
jgi:hypothetical protein